MRLVGGSYPTLGQISDTTLGGEEEKHFYKELDMEDSNPLFWIIAAAGGLMLGGMFLFAMDSVGFQQQLCTKILDQGVCKAVAELLEL